MRIVPNSVTLGFVVAGGVSAAMLGHAADVTAQSDDPSSRSKTVEITHDSKPFDYTIHDESPRQGFRVLRLSYPSPVTTSHEPNNTVPAELFLPDDLKPGDPPRPAVICLHILDGNFELVRITCSTLAAHGVPTIWFKLPYYGERGLPEGPEAMADDVELFLSAVEQSHHDIRRTIDLLASREELDGEKIGITGISLGGITAATAAGMEPRLRRAALVLAGGDLATIIAHARETRDLQQMLEQLAPERRRQVEATLVAVDPLTHAPALRQRALEGRVLFINAGEDEVIPPACTRKLAEALGVAERIRWLDGLGHYTAMAELPDILRQLVEFFGQDLPQGVEIGPPKTSPKRPLEVLATLVSQTGRILTGEPRPGRCHLVDAEVSVVLKEGEKRQQGRLRLIRGARWRFNLEADVPQLGRVAVGQSDAPWMRSAADGVFLGNLPAGGETVDPLSFAEQENVLKLRMVSGAAAGVALAPDVLGQWMSVTETQTTEKPRSFAVVLKDKSHGRLEIDFRDDGRTPSEIRFQVNDVSGTVKIRAWQTDAIAHDTMFEPPPDLPVEQVPREEIYRTMAAMFNFGVEKTQ